MHITALIVTICYLVDSVCVNPQGCIRVHILQFVVNCLTVRARDLVVRIIVCFLSQIADAEAADVVLAAGRDEDGTEVSQADRTVILHNIPLRFVIHRKVVSRDNIALFDLGSYSHFVLHP